MAAAERPPWGTSAVTERNRVSRSAGASPKAMPVSARNARGQSERRDVDTDYLGRGIRPGGAAASSAATVHPREQQAEGRANGRQQQAFGEQLANQAPPPGAERRADRDFPSRPGAREQEVGDVRAGDEQHDQDRGGEHLQRAADVAHEQLLERDQTDVPLRSILDRDVGQRGEGGFERGTRLLDGDVRFQPPDDRYEQ